MAKSSKVSLADKFDLSIEHQLLNGSQAIARLLLMQRAKDDAAGLNTAGYVSGYRGSPIAGLEGQLERLQPLLEKNHIKFKSGLNEDLAATAVWGSQQVGLYPKEAKYDGVFAVWYGKGPGVDRTGDVFRHANHAGTSKHGGVLALLGDDHVAESSTSAHQSEFAMVDYMIPVLNPAGVQEMIDYGIHGFALSRFAGVWVSLKCVKDNIESTATVDGRLDRVKPIIPVDFEMPPGGLNIRLGDMMLPKEARLHEHKRDAILAYAKANKLDKIVCSGGEKPKIGIITTGKSYLDVRQAMEELGIDEVAANELGLRLYKVAMPYPMETDGLKAFAEGLDLIIVVEEKRSLIEVQVKEELFNAKYRAFVIGKKDESEKNWLFPAKGALDPTDIALKMGERIITHCHGPRVEGVKSRITKLKQQQGNEPVKPEVASRLPYFCPGCPHNSSTVVPEGSRAYAGIGCHFMAHWMNRSTEGFTQMGGEGSNWLGEAPFVTPKHVFQNLGDGTYTHSGSLAVRAAVNAGVNITYKILYNDAVAMTGGQHLDGGLTVPMIVNQMLAENVKKVVIVSDEPHKYPTDSGIPSHVEIFHRDELQTVQKRLRDIEGVTVLVYDQTCAAEKRRRRKRGTFPDPDKRILINTDVCEGCGDCSKKSNCVAVSPTETPLGTKRAIDQSACNKDFSCVNGFCPSFVTVHGPKIRKSKTGMKPDAATIALVAGLPTPKQPPHDKPYTMLVAGVGGTGVVTIAAVLGQAAHLDGKGFGGIEMAGLAQKGGPVACHMRIAKRSEDIHAIRAGSGTADFVLGCDLVVTGSSKVLDTIRPDHTAVVYSPHETNIAMFTLNSEYKLPGGALARSIEDRVRKGPIAAVDAQHYAVKLFGDSIAANMFMVGYAAQLGFIPVSIEAIEQAIDLNGAAVEMSRNAFRMGRLAAHDITVLDKLVATDAAPAAPAVLETFESIVAHRMGLLADYQDAAYAKRYEVIVRRVADAEKIKSPGMKGLAEAAAKGLYKLMAYKDEYEVGRLYSSPAFKAQLDAQFSEHGKLEFHLAPPLLARRNKETGEPRKMTFGAWMLPVFGWLAKGKTLRGGRFDVFGYTAERRLEREMIANYEGVLGEICERLTPANHATAVNLAKLALDIKGFGHIKLRNHGLAKEREKVLLAQLRNPGPTTTLRAAE